MQLTDHSIAAAVATGRPRVRLVLYLCLIGVMCTIALGLGPDRLIPRALLAFDPTSQTTSGHLSSDQARAVALAKQYCARLTGATCDIDPAEVTTVSTHIPGRKRSLHEWNVYGRAGVSHCFLGLDPNTKALRIFTRESAFTSGETSHTAPSAAANGDIGTLSEAAAERYASLYLTRAGIVLPRRARLVRVVSDLESFGYDLAVGDTRLLRVSIDPSDGRLLLLEDRTSRRSPHEAPDASAVR